MRHATAAIVGAVALALGACGDDDGGGGDSAKYPAEVRKAFLDSCDAQPGADKSECECSLSKVEEKYSIDEFKGIEDDIRAGKEPPKEFVDLAQSCAKK